MQETNKMRDRLINEFAENYMEKLFYFCLKKTGNNIEAEDLTQDVALQIITALNKGTIPTSFSAWVWQIARNRYSVWAKAKHSRNESVTGSDISDYEIEDESENPLDEMIHTEQMEWRSFHRNAPIRWWHHTSLPGCPPVFLHLFQRQLL